MPQHPNNSNSSGRHVSSQRTQPPQRDTTPEQTHPHPPVRHIKESTLPVGNKS